MDDSTKQTLRWFFKVDLKDWTNYAAIFIAGILLWWGLKTIVGTVTGAASGAP